MVRRVDSASDDRVPVNTNWEGCAFGDLNAVWGLPGSPLRPLAAKFCPAYVLRSVPRPAHLDTGPLPHAHELGACALPGATPAGSANRSAQPAPKITKKRLQPPKFGGCRGVAGVGFEPT
jgi:hypothetical protein